MRALILSLILAVAVSSSLAAAVPFVPLKDDARVVASPIVSMDRDNRLDGEEFAAIHKSALQELRNSHSASGLVECGDAHGAGQLALTNDTIVTAAHVLFDETGAKRAKSCDFVAEVDGAWKRIPVEMSSLVVGTTHPYDLKPVHDWAIAKLARPLEGAAPYELATGVAVNEPVEFVARGHSNWRSRFELSFEDCALRAKTDEIVGGAQEFAFDCSTGDGASGGAVLVGEGRRQLGAILVGWRSTAPLARKAYSPAHYNFVISIEGAFRRALLRAASDVRLPPATEANANAGRGNASASTSRRSAVSH
jgi:hypothetical protein